MYVISNLILTIVAWMERRGYSADEGLSTPQVRGTVELLKGRDVL